MKILITEQQRAVYERDGVVHLPGVVSPATLARLTACFTQAMDDFKRDNQPLSLAQKIGAKAAARSSLLESALGGSIALKLFDRARSAHNEKMDGERLDLSALADSIGNKRTLQDAKPADGKKFFVITGSRAMYPEMRHVISDSELPELAAALYGSPHVSYYEDQLFFKEPGSATRTAFHQDAPYFDITGEQCASFWIPLDVVDKSNGAMGYVPGSHRSGKIYRPNLFVSQEPIVGSPGDPLPDIEGNEEAHGVVYFDAEPGDIIAHHYRVIHGSTGNVSTTRQRRAIAIRYCGEDIRYFKRVGAPPKAHRDIFKDGDELDREPLPRIWPTP